MEARKKVRIALICAALVILLASVVLSVCLLFSNYQNVQLLRQAESVFRQGDAESLKLAQTQLLSLTANDPDNEYAFVLLAEIAKRNKIYPEYIYYSLRAHKLNPLSEKNEKAYIESLLYARSFERLETFLALKGDLDGELNGFLLYAAGQNGNIAKYRGLLDRRDDNLIAELALLLYKHTHLDNKAKLSTLQNYLKLRAKNDFHRQEIFAAMARIHLQANNLDQAEKCLLEAYQLNEFAFAPVLGRFYANYRSLGQALNVFEKYLATYHDPMLALQCAEIYCLLKKSGKIRDLLKHYQGDSGKDAMLLCYYFEVLAKFAANDVSSCRDYLGPLQNVVNTPLATFIYLCAELDHGTPAGVHKYYNAMLEHRNYLDLQQRSDRLMIDFVKKSFAEKTGDPILAELAKKVYWRAPDVTVGKYLLLVQRQNGSVDLLLLGDVMKRFPKDQGVIKIALEYYLAHDLVLAEKLIDSFMKNFPKQQGDMLKYRIILGVRQKKFDVVSRLFQQNYSDDLAGAYWDFAISQKRTGDLRFLCRNPQYKPFCLAAILLAEGKKKEALDILAKADAGKNLTLLFFAARTLAENDRHQEALHLYKQFPEKSPYRLDVLLNSAELYSALGNHAGAVSLAKAAYKMAPDHPAVQYCLADKLYKNGQLAEIAAVAKLSQNSPFRSQMQAFLIASLEFTLKNCDMKRDRDKILNTSERLLRLAPGHKVALEYFKKVQTMPRQE